MVIVPQPAARRTPAQDALRDQGVEFEVVDVSADPLEYGRLLRRLWEAGDTFVLVEHDLVPPAGAIAELLDCDRPLCGFDYAGHEGDAVGHSLGVTKFGDELMAIAPDAWKGWGDNRPLYRAGDDEHGYTFNRDGDGDLVRPGHQWDLVEWINLDGAIWDSLAGYGIFVNDGEDRHLHRVTFHTHEPPVEHRTIATG